MTERLRPSIEWADTILGSYIHGAAAVAESIAMDGQSIGSKVAAVTHNRYILGRGTRLGLGSRRTRYTVR